MDQMLPSPGFSIPSIGTPLHQPEEDQQLLPPSASPLHSRQQPQPVNSFGLTLPHQQQQSSGAVSSQPLYSMPGFTPQHMLQPQTPVTGIFNENINPSTDFSLSCIHSKPLCHQPSTEVLLGFWETLKAPQPLLACSALQLPLPHTPQLRQIPEASYRNYSKSLYLKLPKFWTNRN